MRRNHVDRAESEKCHFRFVLYQMSKNLSRPFFMDFLTCLSVRFSQKVEEIDTDSDTGNIESPFIKQTHSNGLVLVVLVITIVWIILYYSDMHKMRYKG